jgi:hypothetical protein
MISDYIKGLYVVKEDVSYGEYVYLVKAESLDDAYDVASDYIDGSSFDIRPLGEILDELEDYPAQCLGGHAE